MENTEGLREIEVIAEEVSGVAPDNSEDIIHTKYSAKLPTRSRYHGYPTQWDKSIAAYRSGMEMREVMTQAEFHRIALNEVRKALGSKCLHLIHTTDRSGIITFRAKLNVNGTTKVVNVDSQAQANQLDAESYRNLNTALNAEFRG